MLLINLLPTYQSNLDVAFGGRYVVQIRNGLEFGMEISDQIVSIFDISISFFLQVIVDKIHMGWSVVHI